MVFPVRIASVYFTGCPNLSGLCPLLGVKPGSSPEASAPCTPPGARGGGQRTFVGNVGMTVAEENPAPLFSEMRSQEINPNGLSYPRHVGIAGLLSAKSLA